MGRRCAHSLHRTRGLSLWLTWSRSSDLQGRRCVSLHRAGSQANQARCSSFYGWCMRHRSESTPNRRLVRADSARELLRPTDRFWGFRLAARARPRYASYSVACLEGVCRWPIRLELLLLRHQNGSDRGIRRQIRPCEIGWCNNSQSANVCFAVSHVDATSTDGASRGPVNGCCY